MMKQKSISTIIILLVFFIFSSQLLANSSIDSLELLLQKSKGYEKVFIYSELSNALWFNNPQKSKEYAYKSYKYALSIEDTKAIALSTNSLATSFFMLSEYDSAEYYINKSLTLYKELSDTLQIANNFRIIADIYSTRGENKVAQEYYIESYKLFEKILNKKNVSIAINKLYSILLNNFATFYNSLDDFENAQKYYRLALSIYDKIDNQRSQSIAYFNLAHNFYRTYNIDSTLANLDKSVQIAKKIDNTSIIAKSYQVYASIYSDNGDHQKAFKLLDSAIIIYSNLDDLNSIAGVYYQQVSIYYSLNKFKIALDLQKECLELAYKIDNKQLRLESYGRIASLYENLNDYKQAYSFFRQFANLSDSLEAINNKVLIAEMDKKFNFEKQNRENSELKYQNDIKELNNNRLIIIVASLIVVLILASLSIFNLRRRQKFETLTNKILEEKNSELVLTNATKDKFFSIIAHDLRNPIGGFTKVVHLLQDDSEDLDKEERVSLLELLNESAANLSELLENLLNWANSQRGLIRYNPTEINSYYIVESSINELGLSAKNKGIILNSIVSKDLFIFADANMLTTIFRNFITNAIKFTPNNGTITVGSIENKSDIIFFIKDSGVGIPKDKINKLFEIGENTSTNGTNNERGTGLGLILSNEFITKHNGKVWVESEIGVGSTFYFSIPKSN